MDNKIMTVLIGLFVCVLMVGSVLVPIVESSQETIEPITEYNIGTGQTYREAKSGDIFQLTSVYDADTGKKTDTWTLNGEEVMNSNTFAWNVGIVSNVMWIEVFNSANSSSAIFYEFNAENPLYKNYVGAGENFPNAVFTWEFTDNKISYSNGNTMLPYTAEYDYSWAYVPCSIEDGGYMASSLTADVTSLVNNVDDIILCGTYTTGELDTGYYYYKGDSCVTSTDYTGENTTELTLKDGTYDLYYADISFTVSDGTTIESFEPFRALVPYEVHGHADSGTTISLLGVIPVIVIIALLSMAVVALFRSKY